MTQDERCLVGRLNILVALSFSILLFLASSLLAGTCDCDISPSQVATFNSLLNLTPAQQAEAIHTHLPWGTPVNPPTATHEHLLYQQDYILDYDDDLRVPIWAAYKLTAQEVEARRKRTQCFRNDPRLLDASSAFCADYDEPIFDRGHLVPNADMTRSESAMINTYMFSNMTPQYANFNRGIWNRLEGYVRKWAEARGEIYVISGTVFDRDHDGHRDPDDQAELVSPTHRVAIPTAFYKIILYKNPDGGIESMAFLLPHDNHKHIGKEAAQYLNKHLTSIGNIESITGLEFLPRMRKGDSSDKTALETGMATAFWAKH